MFKAMFSYDSEKFEAILDDFQSFLSCFQVNVLDLSKSVCKFSSAFTDFDTFFLEGCREISL